MAFMILFDPFFTLFLLLVLGFTIWLAWNFISSFKTGEVYDLGKKPLYGYDKSGKWHPIIKVNQKEDPVNFGLARIHAGMMLLLALIVTTILVLVVVF